MSIGSNSNEFCKSFQKAFKTDSGNWINGLLFLSRLGQPFTHHQVLSSFNEQLNMST